MTTAEIEILARAHALFGGAEPAPAALGIASLEAPPARGGSAGALADAYRDAAQAWRADGQDTRLIDAELARILARAVAAHDDGRARTAAVLAAARADNPILDNPIAARDLLRRSAVRLREQHDHVLTARGRARRRRAALLRLRYRLRARRHRGRDARADGAVRAALSRLGSPYVWGATGPDRFDCSGLVQWAYAHTGVHLHRTTYDQINDGIPVSRADVRPGDLIFPHAGHVQMAIGNGLVVEAPHAGASVQISPLGGHVAIRRPV